ncbi:MAG: helix-turn-helix domain-containing protein [Anaerocolumna sp.]
MNIQEIDYLHSTVDLPMQKKFILHTHSDFHELIFLIQGDVTFYAEGNAYSLQPYDIVFARNNELHQVLHNSITPYERIVVKIHTGFFEKYYCNELNQLFTGRNLGQKNLIPHSLHDSFQINRLFQKIDTYLKDNNNIGALCVFTEILTLLHKLSKTTLPMIKNNRKVNEVINYIHTHLSDSLTLDSLANGFYINKQYLCKIFKRSTGYTINQYINLRRYLLTEELIKQGKSKTTAAFEAGFNTYSTYYKISKLHKSQQLS